MQCGAQQPPVTAETESVQRHTLANCCVCSGALSIQHSTIQYMYLHRCKFVKCVCVCGRGQRSHGPVSCLTCLEVYNGTFHERVAQTRQEVTSLL